jgi:hypothetical protein
MSLERFGREQTEEAFEPETPFLGTGFVTDSWQQRERSDTIATFSEQNWAPQVETPFLTEYQGEAPANLEAIALGETLLELHDEQFNEAVANLALEAAAQAEQFAAAGGEAAAEQLLGEWLDPLRRETESLFERVAEAAGQQQIEASGESEVNTLLERFAPQPGAVAPEFEQFFQQFFGKIGKVLKAGVNLAKKGIAVLGKVLPLGAILKRLVGLVRPLLDRVIKFALNRLPPALRPAATLLGRRLGILREAGSFETETPGAASEEAEAPAFEFDASVVGLMFARDEAEMELLAAEEAAGGPMPGEAGPTASLDAARERFVSQFAQLQAGESAAPVIQQFLPAILPVLRVALTVIGRQRVVNFLAGHLARLIQSSVGPQAATALSRALVDIGLRLITLEAEAEAAPNEAARAVAATLEDTVRQLAEMGFERFDQLDESPEQQRVLETLATEAFFQSAIAHIPAQLLDARRLDEREMMPEMSGEAGVWAYRPRPRYKKYTRVFEITLTPQAAARVRSFGTTTLAAFLRARGVRPPVKVRVHLYEAIPGTVLSRIALLERRVPGLGSGGEAAWSQIHPLTTEAAGMLLNEPGLGKDVAPAFLETRHRIGVGQRFFYLELPRGTGPGPSVGPRCPPSQLSLAIDLRSSQVRAYWYLGETDAQRVVAAGPRVGPATAVQLFLGLQHALTGLAGGPSRHVKIYREMMGELEGEEFWQAALAEAGKKLLTWFLVELGKALLNLLRAAIVAYLNTRLAEFTAATRDPACGVTLVFTFNHPGLRVLQVLLARRLPSPADVRAAIAALRPPSVGVVAGYRGA